MDFYKESVRLSTYIKRCRQCKLDNYFVSFDGEKCDFCGIFNCT